MSDTDDALRQIHQAIGELLDNGELAVAWTLTIDVAGPDDLRYLAHRAGGGFDGTDPPMTWTALGMLRASVQVAEQQLIDTTVTFDEDDEEEAG